MVICLDTFKFAAFQFFSTDISLFDLDVLCSLNKKETNGMVAIMDMHRDMRAMAMLQFLKTLTCTMEGILVTGTISSHNSSNRWDTAEQY